MKIENCFPAVVTGDSPEAGAGSDEVEHLRRVEQLLEAPQEADALVVARLGVDEDEQRRAALRPHRLPGLVRACKTKNKLVCVTKKLTQIFLPDVRWAEVTVRLKGWTERQPDLNNQTHTHTENGSSSKNRIFLKSIDFILVTW